MSQLLVVSASLRPHGKSERLSALCCDALADRGATVKRASLQELILPFFDDTSVYESAGFKELYRLTDEAEGIVLCSPIYNWSTGSELKKYIECVGSSDATRRGAFFDKVITFVNAAGLPQSYMAFGSLAVSMMMDFKCVVNPYNLYVDNAQWDGDALTPAAAQRLHKTMDVMVELTQLLSRRTYASTWEI
jgi:NAD(P)H-dependent FMN reductase